MTGGRFGGGVTDSLGGGGNLPNKLSACCIGLVLLLLVRFETVLCLLLQSITILSLMPPVCLILLLDAGIISGETNLSASNETGRGLLWIASSSVERGLKIASSSSEGGLGLIDDGVIGSDVHGGFHWGRVL